MKKNNNAVPTCRFCDAALIHTFVDLGMSPLSNAYLTADKLRRMEPFFPLHAHVCGSCFLVQLEEFQSPSEIFTDYAYFSSYSASWLDHARRYAREMVNRFAMDATWQVVEIASNDGYLLRDFKQAGIPVLGIEPAENVAKVAQQAGIPTVVKFFGAQTAMGLVADGVQADLLVGNNVLAHVPALNDFVAGMKTLLSARGVITMEFPHLMRLMSENQFDTIYHEHFSYLSLLTVEKVFAHHGLRIFDVAQLPTHGGSLRIYACHSGNGNLPQTAAVEALRRQEQGYGLDRMETYTAFGEQVRETKRKLLEFLIRAKRDGKRIVGYGAPAQGSTLLNYCGIRTDFLDYTVDISPHKQGLYLPGTRIPIFAPDKISETRPDYVLILPWNLREEVMNQMAQIRMWGGQFLVPIPEIRVYP
ncbi:MAG: methyltransferase domain-containing protein [Gammaproteobacteria bacterium]|nr:methyltransferase domain-containing protein [Gammaproteobacteria bacterium]